MIQPGERAPDFTLVDQHGREVASARLRGSRVALVFFPLAFSGVCGDELAELAANTAMFDEAQTQLVGVTVDSVFALRAWSDAAGATFPLASDFWPHGHVARRFGAFDERTGRADRATIMIDEGGIVRASFRAPPHRPRSLAQYTEALAALPHAAS
ncbi:Peroxiredoxin [Paramicrobacterium humi]|uniref:Peroxiredoxin n=1 Tax=Paramicrobacterium humi TaxID=640635 RepID=A0A1H4QHC5_9MICO|nr:redoxin domain-containing protein [Microbacterium humi]SEC18984.1 Peroxiredoxin [Microbacterium humi]